MTDRSAFLNHVSSTLAGIEADGLMKRERLITGAQGAHVAMAGRQMPSRWWTGIATANC